MEDEHWSIVCSYFRVLSFDGKKTAEKGTDCIFVQRGRFRSYFHFYARKSHCIWRFNIAGSFNDDCSSAAKTARTHSASFGICVQCGAFCALFAC